MKYVAACLSGAFALGMWGCREAESAHAPLSPLADDGGYVGVQINTGDIGDTRAGNGTTDPGTTIETRVYNCALLFFTGASESEAVFQGAYDVGGDNGYAGTYHSFVKTVKLPEKTLSQKVYVLAMCNYYSAGRVEASSGDFIFQTRNASDNSYSDSPDRLTSGISKFSDLQGITTNVELDRGKTEVTSTAFFMTNAPMNSVKGTASNPGNGKVTTLVEIDGKKIHSTDAEAAQDPCANVWVERALAKISFTNNLANGNSAGGLALKDADGNDVTLTYNTVYYQIVNREKTTYVVRNLGIDNGAGFKGKYNPNAPSGLRFRFVGDVSYSGRYLTYWSVDPHYDTDLGNSRSDYEPVSFTLGTVYCMENTFDVEHQNYKNSPMVVVRVQFKISGAGVQNLYTLDNNPTVIYTPAQKASYEAAHEGEKYEFQTYTNGYAYYETRIMHFADTNPSYDLAPWNAPDMTTYTTAEAYPNYDVAKYLGRYGMVRNNWYSLILDEISQLGAPTPGMSIVDNPDLPDDNNVRTDKMTLRVKVRPWTVRMQVEEV